MVLLVSGCSGRRFLHRSTVGDTTHTEHEIRYIERLRDTVIYITLPDEWREQETVRDSSYLETSIAYSEALIDSSGKLIHSLHNKTVTKPVTVTVKNTAENTIQTIGKHHTERIEIPVEKPLTWLQKTLMYCGVIFLTSIIVCLVVHVVRRSK